MCCVFKFRSVVTVGGLILVSRGHWLSIDVATVWVRLPHRKAGDMSVEREVIRFFCFLIGQMFVCLFCSHSVGGTYSGREQDVTR